MGEEAFMSIKESHPSACPYTATASYHGKLRSMVALEVEKKESRESRSLL